MAKLYYYNENGEKIGIANGEDLQELVAQGIITPDTTMEYTGIKGLAGQMPGLFPATPLSFSLTVSPEVSAFVEEPEPSNTSTDDTQITVSSQDYDYRRIAMAHQLSTFSIVVFVFANMASRVIDRGMMRDPFMTDELILLALIAFGMPVGALCFSIFCMWHLATLVRIGLGTRVLYAICMFLPIFNFIPLFAVYFFAGGILKKRDAVD